MILGLEFNLPTVGVLLIVVAWAAWAVHRLWSRGMCDCHADSPRGCSGGCGGGRSHVLLLTEPGARGAAPRRTWPPT